MYILVPTYIKLCLCRSTIQNDSIVSLTHSSELNSLISQNWKESFVTQNLCKNPNNSLEHSCCTRSSQVGWILLHFTACTSFCGMTGRSYNSLSSLLTVTNKITVMRLWKHDFDTLSLLPRKTSSILSPHWKQGCLEWVAYNINHQILQATYIILI